MIKFTDILTRPITSDLIERLRPNVVAASLGGISRIRQGDARDESLTIDQWSGQIGEYSPARYVLEDENLYWKTREYVNADPKQPRPGGDYYRFDRLEVPPLQRTVIETLPIDAKCSVMRRGLFAFDYNLIVDLDEYDERLIYVQSLIPNVDVNAFPPGGFSVLICGWAKGTSLRLEENFKNFGKTKRVLPVIELEPMRTLRDYLAEIAPQGILEV